jgi:hypothetical protein
MGRGGLLDALGCLYVLDLVGDAGRRTSIARGAMLLVIGAAAGLGRSLSGVCVHTQGSQWAWAHIGAR